MILDTSSDAVFNSGQASNFHGYFELSQGGKSGEYDDCWYAYSVVFNQKITNKKKCVSRCIIAMQ